MSESEPVKLQLKRPFPQHRLPAGAVGSVVGELVLSRMKTLDFGSIKLTLAERDLEPVTERDPSTPSEGSPIVVP